MCHTFAGNYHDSEKELVGQGLGNIVSGLFGGTAGAGATVRTGVSACSVDYHAVYISDGRLTYQSPFDIRNRIDTCIRFVCQGVLLHKSIF